MLHSGIDTTYRIVDVMGNRYISWFTTRVCRLASSQVLLLYMPWVSEINSLAFLKMTRQQRMKAELKVVRALKYWKDADIFRLQTKKKIAEMVVAELEDYFAMERGL